MRWDISDHRCWAKALGLAPASLLAVPTDDPYCGTVLLDGRKSSFALFAPDNVDLVVSAEQPLSWTWSAYLNDTVIVDSQNTDLIIRRWATPSEYSRVSAPRSPEEAWTTLDRILNSKADRSGEDVVQRLLTVFKHMRAAMAPLGAKAEDVVYAFNLILDVLSCSDRASELRRCIHLGDVLSLGVAHTHDIAAYSAAQLSDALHVLDRTRDSPTRLSPSVLLRHASGHLYQEAHFELERIDHQLALLGGFAQSSTTTKAMQRDARFTPPELARTLAEQAFSALPNIPHSVSILDPACGSGVFLIAALHELERRQYRGLVTLTGIDTSPVSRVMATYCLDHAVADARRNGITASHSITQENALERDWGQPDVILMNPPFTRWRDMGDSDRENTRSILADSFAGHSDKAMAFVTKASNSIKHPGVLATVIPSTMLDGQAGTKWRESLTSKNHISAVGRFNGYSYFPGALVEPAFFVLASKPEQCKSQLAVLIAEPGHEGTALRELRRLQQFESRNTEHIFVSREESTGALTSSSWMPRTLRYRRLLDGLTRSHPSTGDLFDIRQGVLTGRNKAFLLNPSDYSALRRKELRYFRPAIVNLSVASGRISDPYYVFFPYAPNGSLLLHTERDLREAVPSYYATHLAPQKQDLQKRSGFHELWWTLTRERLASNHLSPKLLSTYFGGPGSFAFDSDGGIVPVQGYSWQWIGDTALHGSAPEDDLTVPTAIAFTDTVTPFAYLALLNSTPFGFLLTCYCARVQGGQCNLSRRYVSRIPLPDLMRGPSANDLIDDLVRIGRHIHLGRAFDDDRLTDLVSRAYGVNADTWPQ